MLYILSILLLFILIVFSYMYFEAKNVEIVRLNLSTKGSLKIMHLSDLHISMLKVSPNKLKQILLKECPDIVIISGDYIDKPIHIDSFIDFLVQSSLNKYKTYLSLGNHDHKALKKYSIPIDLLASKLNNINCSLLINDAVIYSKNNNTYNIVAFDDLKCGVNEIEKALFKINQNATSTIAFSHNPDIIFDLPKDKIDILLCGHFHGGQLWMPFHLEFKILRSDRLCKMGIYKGLNTVNGIKIYINRGLGNVVVPLRLFSRPEITIINI